MISRLPKPQPPSIQHLAIIMDGNGRWAKKQGLPRTAGHHAGVKTVRRMVELAIARDIRVLSLFAFSSENWTRPPTEVKVLLQLFLSTLEDELDELYMQGVRLQIVGDLSAFPKRLQKAAQSAQAKTAHNVKLVLVLALSYGGRWDIVQAARQLAEQVAAQKLQPKDIDSTLFASRLSLAGLPEPELLVRTSGEQRISNFFLWDLAYSELYFTERNWPDFDENELDAALMWYAGRQRRFGGV